jgi:hypothetical protein
MGQTPSAPVAPVCYNPAVCEPEVAYVASECNKVGTNILHLTLRRAIIAIAGETYGNQILSQYNPALAGTREYEWDTWQSEVVATLPENVATLPENVATLPDETAGFKNYEGFVEGATNNGCVECSCSAAAEKLIAKCRNANPQVPNAIVDVITRAQPLLSSNLRKAMNNGTDTSGVEPVDQWRDKYQPGSYVTTSNTDPSTTDPDPSATAPDQFTNRYPFTNRETFTNRESFINTESDAIYPFIKDAVEARHTKFKFELSSPTYEFDCSSIAYYSMKRFIPEEKKMLDTLFGYYINYVSSYESLYLHKESIIKIINGKLDELDKIQSKIDNYKTNLHVDNRKNNYQTSNYEFYNTVRKYMLILYYSLFILYLIFSNFLREKQYTNKKILLVLAIYLLIPIILSYAINLTYEGYIYFLESNNIKEDTKSYADIIKA